MNLPSEASASESAASGARRGRLVDRVAVITGAASGIGKEIALAYARDGAEVVIADLDRKAAQETAAAIDPTLQRALGIAMDVSNEDEVEAGITPGDRSLRAPRVGTVTIRGTGETIEALLDPTTKPARDETLQASRAPPMSPTRWPFGEEKVNAIGSNGRTPQREGRTAVAAQGPLHASEGLFAGSRGERAVRRKSAVGGPEGLLDGVLGAVAAPMGG